MRLVRFEHVHKSFGPTAVLLDATWQVDRGQRIGMVGDNGVGKTTVLRLITGALTPDAGDVAVHDGARVAMLEQMPSLDPDLTPRDIVLDSRPELRELEYRIQQLGALVSDPEQDPRGRSRDRLLALHSEALDAFTCLGGHEFEARVGRTLAGLGLPQEAQSLPVRKLSGGQRSRVALAKVLLDDPDLLLLDEPTNHLDIQAIEWLQSFLEGFRGAFVAISHDRYFLDRVAQRIAEVEDGRIRDYAGGFTAYSEAKERELEAQARAYEQQQREIRRQEEWIRWRMQQGTEKAVRMAKSRARLLAKIERIERPTLERPRPAPKFAQPRAGSSDIVELVDLEVRYGDRVLFTDLNLMLIRGNRIGVIGPNGSGKTTLLRTILGEVRPDRGRARVGPSVRVGYYCQEREDLDPSRSVLEHIRDARPDLSPLEARTFLARFLFHGDDVFLPVEVLSGGERSRVALALLILGRPDLLLLDEPTNHLDIVSREVFEDALVDYRGTLMVASHDRYFLNRTVDRLLIMDSERPEVFIGSYSALLAAREEARLRAAEAEANRRSTARQQRPARPRPPSPPRKQPPVLPSVDQVEEEIAAAEARLAEVTSELTRSETYSSGETVRTLSAEYDALTAKLADLYDLYEQVSEATTG